MQGFRRAAVHLALVALLLRAFLPTGWMPNAGGHGEAFLVACTQDGAGQQTDRHQKDQDGQHSHDECPFAAAPHIAVPAIAAQLAPPSYFGRFTNTADSAAVAVRFSGYQPQSPRAPPSFS